MIYSDNSDVITVQHAIWKYTPYDLLPKKLYYKHLFRYLYKICLINFI